MSASGPDPIAWTVARPWRRFRRELWGGTAWFGVVSVLVVWTGGELWVLGVLSLAAAYVLGPLVLPTRVVLDATGIRRASALGERLDRWERFAGYSIARRGQAAFLHRGAGAAGRVLGSVMLLLPDAESERTAVLARFAERWPAPTAP